MKPRILVVDDDAVSRLFNRRVLEPRYEVTFAVDAQEARGKLIGAPIDLLICDIYLPGENGMELIETLLSRDDDVAVIVVTSADDPSLVERAFELGVYGYLVKPYRSGDLLITVNNALRRRQLEIRAHAHERALERDVITQSLETKRVRQLLRHTERSLEESRLETVQKLSLAVEMRDQVTGHHLSRMGAYCEELARRLGLPDHVCESIAPAAQMHDIGKIAVPDHILLKRGPLTADERAQMQTHSDVGRRILQGSDSPLLQLAESIAWTHHEKFDGGGYPRGLTADEIPIEGRVAAVADVFDALTRERPYRDAMSPDQAAEIMADGRRSHFDPDVLDTFMHVVPAAEVLA